MDAGDRRMIGKRGREEKGCGREGRKGGTGRQRSPCGWIRLAGCGWLVKGVWEEDWEE